MANLKFMNMLTHDEYEPFICGFSLRTFCNDEGDRIVEHNGFNNIDKQTLEDFKSIVAMMEIQLAVNESKEHKCIEDVLEDDDLKDKPFDDRGDYYV